MLIMYNHKSFNSSVRIIKGQFSQGTRKDMFQFQKSLRLKSLTVDFCAVCLSSRTNLSSDSTLTP